MNKLKPISPEKLIKIIKKLGFEEIRQKGSHKFFRNPEGKTTIVPFHKGENISKGLLLKILKDIDITREDFLNLI